MSAQLASPEARDRERRQYIGRSSGSRLGRGELRCPRPSPRSDEAAARVLSVDEAIVGEDAFDPRQSRAQALLEAVRAPFWAAGAKRSCEFELSASEPTEGEPRAIRPRRDPWPITRAAHGARRRVRGSPTDLIRSKKITAWAEMARQVAREIRTAHADEALRQHLRQAWRDRHPKFGGSGGVTETIVDQVRSAAPDRDPSSRIMRGCRVAACGARN